MVEESPKDEWVRTLTGQPPEHDGQPWEAQAVGETQFTLLELKVPADTDLTPGDRVTVENKEAIDVNQRLAYHTLTQPAQERLKETIAAIIADNEQRFIDYYNSAQPIGLGQHQLDFLPEIGEKRRDAIIDERKLGPFEDFTDLETRVDSLHDPQTLLVDRTLTELVEVEEARYKLLVS
jgi:putative nucleotide binding protein